MEKGDETITYMRATLECLFLDPLFHISEKNGALLPISGYLLTEKNSMKIVDTTAKQKQDFCFYLKEVT